MKRCGIIKILHLFSVVLPAKGEHGTMCQDCLHNNIMGDGYEKLEKSRRTDAGIGPDGQSGRHVGDGRGYEDDGKETGIHLPWRQYRGRVFAAHLCHAHRFRSCSGGGILRQDRGRYAEGRCLSCLRHLRCAHSGDAHVPEGRILRGCGHQLQHALLGAYG